MNILFTCVGRRVALIDAFRKAMDELGVRGQRIATDITIASAAFQEAEVAAIVPPADRDEYIPALLKLVEQHEVGLLVPLTDVDLQLLAEQRDRFAEAGCTVMIGSDEAVALCRDKARLNELCGQAGLGTIHTVSLREFHAEPFYPCFVKPVSGSAGIGAEMVRNEEELAAHVATYGEDLLVQEYIPGQEFTIDAYCSRDGKVRCVVPRQRLVVRSGEVEKGITTREASLIEETIKLAGLLEGLWGVFCCQCRRGDDAVVRFFEVNARFGGGAPLSVAAGANLPLYLLQEVLGLPITAEIGTFTDRLLMLRYDRAVYRQVDDPASLPGFETPTFR